MTNTEQPQGKNLWDDVRETVIAGLKDWRDKGEDMARQGRIRMDEVQTERRLRAAHEALGAKICEMFAHNEPVTPEHPVVSQLLARVRYYQDDLSRLRTERAHHSEMPT